MEGRLIVLFATLTVFVASGVQGTSHLSFVNTTVDITRDGCGTTKLCLDLPTDCDPSTNTSCLFVSFNVTAVMAPNGTDVSVELRGSVDQPLAYVAMGLTQSATEGMTRLFVCTRNGSETFFQTLMRNNTSGMLNAAEIRVTEIRRMVKDNVIRCEFDIPGLNATMNRNSAATAFNVLVGTGNVTADGAIGSFTPLLTRAVNLADPTVAPTGPLPSGREVNITRDGCGTTKLCLDLPTDCDPSTNTSCLFVSFNVTAVMAPNGADVSVELRGSVDQSLAYVAMGLTQSATEGMTRLFACTRNGSETLFQTLMRNNTNGMLNTVNIQVTGFRSMVKGNVIRCVFDIPGVNATMNRNNAATAFTVLVGTGNVTADGTIGSFNPSLTRTVNLAEPTSGTTTAAPMTTVPATTASSGSVHPHALLILLSVFALFAMLRS